MRTSGNIFRNTRIGSRNYQIGGVPQDIRHLMKVIGEEGTTRSPKVVALEERYHTTVAARALEMLIYAMQRECGKSKRNCIAALAQAGYIKKDHVSITLYGDLSPTQECEWKEFIRKHEPDGRDIQTRE